MLMETNPLGSRESQCYLKHWAHMVPEEGEQLVSAQAKLPKDNFIKTGAESCNTQLKELPLFSCYLPPAPVLLNTMI